MNIKQDLLPTSASNRPGTTINVRYITVHETANTRKGANAEMHARYIKGQDARNRSVSWHYTTDDKEIIQHLPDNERGWHAGNGNGSSIGVELCVNEDGDFEKTKKNAAWLIQQLMKKHNIPISRVVTHKHWTGKNCPARLLNQWDSFKRLISGTSAPTQPQTGGAQVSAPKAPTPAPSSSSKTIAQMANEVMAGQHGSGHDNRRKSLGISASEYEKVRAEVNRRAGVTSTPTPAPKPAAKSIAQMAQEVIDGKHGNGHEARRKSLGISQAQYNQVRDEVNKRASGGGSAPKKSVSQMATEVIQGKHGTGHANRQRSLGINATDYAKVRAEVNRRS